MLERFDKAARLGVIEAVAEARRWHADAVRTEHLLHGLLDHAPAATALLEAWPVDVDDLRYGLDLVERSPGPPLDAAALSTLGIDLDAVRRRAEATFGEGALDRTGAPRRRRRHLRVDRTTVKVLELSLREAIHLRHPVIGGEHLLLAMLHTGTGAAHDLLTARGPTLDRARDLVAERARLADTG